MTTARQLIDNMVEDHDHLLESKLAQILYKKLSLARKLLDLKKFIVFIDAVQRGETAEVAGAQVGLPADEARKLVLAAAQSGML